MSSSTIYSLHYFDGRGRAETTRLVFAQAGQKFEDLRHTHEEWAKLKPQMPLGQLPVLEFNGEKLPQSISIARYVARQFNLAVKDELESAKCDVVADTIQEINDAYFRAWFAIKDEKQKELEQEKFKVDTVPQKLQGLEGLIKTYGNGTWAVGNNVTWADLLIYDSIENLLKLNEQVLDKYPVLQQNRQAVKQLPNIAQYLAARKETPF